MVDSNHWSTFHLQVASATVRQTGPGPGAYGIQRSADEDAAVPRIARDSLAQLVKARGWDLNLQLLSFDQLRFI